MPDIREQVDFYRRRGFVPLPSMASQKKPTIEFARFWEEPVPEDVYTRWRATNLQILTGVGYCPRPLIVVDIDGEDASHVWREMCRHHRHDAPTWTVETGGGGLHLWYLADDVAAAGPSRQIWGMWQSWNPTRPGGAWIKHKEIRVLAERRLVVAPPSVHVETGKPYRFAPGLGPRELPAPARPPAFLKAMPPVKAPGFVAPRRRPPAHGPHVNKTERDRILASVPDKVALARLFGLRVSGRADAEWVACHAIDREDSRPSCTLNSATGVYVDHQSERRLAYPDLIAELGGLSDWNAALQSIASSSGIPLDV